MISLFHDKVQSFFDCIHSMKHKIKGYAGRITHPSDSTHKKVYKVGHIHLIPPQKFTTSVRSTQFHPKTIVHKVSHIHPIPPQNKGSQSQSHPSDSQNKSSQHQSHPSDSQNKGWQHQGDVWLLLASIQACHLLTSNGKPKERSATVPLTCWIPWLKCLQSQCSSKQAHTSSTTLLNSPTTGHILMVAQLYSPGPPEDIFWWQHNLAHLVHQRTHFDGSLHLAERHILSHLQLHQILLAVCKQRWNHHHTPSRRSLLFCPTQNLQNLQRKTGKISMQI